MFEYLIVHAQHANLSETQRTKPFVSLSLLQAPFEFRVRSTPLAEAFLKSNGNAEWRDIVHPNKHANAARR